MTTNQPESSGAGSGERPGTPAGSAADLFAPGLAWTEAMLNAPLRMQAKLASDTLRRLNAPILESLQAQRELADALAAAAAQVAAVAQRIEQLAKQHAQTADQLRAALDPYLRYVDWLGEVGSGGSRGTGSDR